MTHPCHLFHPPGHATQVGFILLKDFLFDQKPDLVPTRLLLQVGLNKRAGCSRRGGVVWEADNKVFGLSATY